MLVEAEIAPIKDVARRIEAKREQVRAIQDQLAHRGLMLKVLQELYEYTPPSISLNELRLTSQEGTTSIWISGQADILSNAFGYTEALKEARLLKELNIENAQQLIRSGGKSVVEFKAECTLSDKIK